MSLMTVAGRIEDSILLAANVGDLVFVHCGPDAACDVTIALLGKLGFQFHGEQQPFRDVFRDVVQRRDLDAIAEILHELFLPPVQLEFNGSTGREGIVRPSFLPPVDSAKTEWSPEKNGRRCDLIDKQIDGTITDDERIELDVLQRQAMAYRDQVAPPPIEGARKLHRELLEKKRQRELQE